MTANIQLVTADGSPLTLKPEDHRFTGGEASVYQAKGRAYKIYTDISRALKAGLEKRVQALKALQHPGVAAPLGLVYSKDGRPLGVELPWVKGDALCTLCTNTWQTANRFTPKQIEQIVRKMREVVDFAHSKDAFLVDGNNMNWLVHKTTPVAIDTDSWALPGFPATAIVASVLDPLVKLDPAGHKIFNADSDWFTWAVVTFELWFGIHPFNGSHPRFARGDFTARMREGISVFDPEVKYPAAAVRDLSNIPPGLRAWYEDVFKGKTRTAPPQDWQAVARQTAPRLRMVQSNAGTVKQTRLGNAGGAVLKHLFGPWLLIDRDGAPVAWNANSSRALEWTKPFGEALRRGTAVMFSRGLELLLAELLDGQLSLYHETGKVASLPSNAERLWVAKGRLFATLPGSANGLVEVGAHLTGARWRLAVEHQWGVNVLTSALFKDCLVQDYFGNPFISYITDKGILQHKAPKLAGHRLVSGLGLDEKNVWLGAIRRSDGQPVLLHFASNGVEYELMESVDCDTPQVDGGRLNSGVGVVRVADTWRVSKDSTYRTVSDPGLDDQVLFSTGDHLCSFKGSEVSRLSLS